MYALMESIEIDLDNREALIDELTVQYIYKKRFQGMSFLMGPTIKVNFLSALETEYQPFIRVARELLEEDFVQQMGVVPEEKDPFIYWLITRWEGLAEQIQAKKSDKPAVLVMSELGRQQEQFLKNLLKKRFAPRVDVLTHTENPDALERTRFVLTDTYSQLIQSQIPADTRIIRMDYNHFDESIRKLEKEVAKDTTDQAARFSAPPSMHHIRREGPEPTN